MKKQRRLSVLRKFKINKEVNLKVKELQDSGYEKVENNHLWEYLLSYRWKRHFPETISEMKEDIHKVTANDFFDYQVICAQTVKSHEFDWKKIKDLLD